MSDVWPFRGFLKETLPGFLLVSRAVLAQRMPTRQVLGATRPGTAAPALPPLVIFSHLEVLIGGTQTVLKYVSLLSKFLTVAGVLPLQSLEL